MPDLITTENRPLATTASAECSPELWRQLTDNQNFLYACDELLEQPAMVSEIIAVASQIEGHAAPCGGKAVVAELAPLVTVYGVSDRSEGEWKTFWAIYTQILGELPISALKAGIKAYVAKPDSEFFPKPGPLKALCEQKGENLYRAIGRVRRVKQMAERRKAA